ncbi:MAG: phosphatase PAP2 family protein [Chloroflexota bacterium]
MSTDVIQQAVQALAYQNGATRETAVFLATMLVFVLLGLWLIGVFRERGRVTIAGAPRILAVMGGSFVLSRVLAHVIVDPRPYLIEGIHPLTHVAADNGFPSDHTLLAAALTAGLWWVDRRLMPLFGAGTLLVMVGRLGVAAHHTLDVGGSVAIVVVVAVVVALVPLPRAWSVPLPLAGRRPARK